MKHVNNIPNSKLVFFTRYCLQINQMPRGKKEMKILTCLIKIIAQFGLMKEKHTQNRNLEMDWDWSHNFKISDFPFLSFKWFLTKSKMADKDHRSLVAEKINETKTNKCLGSRNGLGTEAAVLILLITFSFPIICRESNKIHRDNMKGQISRMRSLLALVFGCWEK